MHNETFSKSNILLAAAGNENRNNGGPRKRSRTKPTRKRGIGRPQKYALVLWSLHDDELYTAATVANRAVALELVDASSEKRIELDRQRIRIAMGRYANNHEFPDNGDGNVRLRGQAPTPGWWGRRWKEHADPLTEEQYRQFTELLERMDVTDRDNLLFQVRRLDSGN